MGLEPGTGVGVGRPTLESIAPVNFTLLLDGYVHCPHFIQIILSSSCRFGNFGNPVLGANFTGEHAHRANMEGCYTILLCMLVSVQ